MHASCGTPGNRSSAPPQLALLPAMIPWYFPQTMFSPSHRLPQAVFRLAACLLVAAGAGCGGKPPWSHEETGPLLDEVKASDLRPGCYCEIDMVLPPGSPEDSFHCYKGTVKEVNANEVVLTDALEVGCNEYGPAARQRPPTQEKHRAGRGSSPRCLQNLGLPAGIGPPPCTAHRFAPCCHASRHPIIACVIPRASVRRPGPL